jgi:hypothetical protein
MSASLEDLVTDLVAEATERHRTRAVEYYDALLLIADIAEGSQTINSLPHIARIARRAVTQDK